MKVYILMYHLEDVEIRGVYDSEKKAKTARQKEIKNDNADTFDRTYYSIEEQELK